MANLKINVRATSEQMIGSVGLSSLGAMANIIEKVIFFTFFILHGIFLPYVLRVLRVTF